METRSFINLTSHPITDVVAGLVVPPTGQMARVTTTQKLVQHVKPPNSDKPVAIYRTDYGEIVGLPEPKEGCVYIVSAPIINALKEQGIERNDVVAPYNTIRDSSGIPRGCSGFRFNG